eukprot:2007256-Pyramimonas_sp.AAC.1
MSPYLRPSSESRVAVLTAFHDGLGSGVWGLGQLSCLGVLGVFVTRCVFSGAIMSRIASLRALAPQDMHPRS